MYSTITLVHLICTMIWFNNLKKGGILILKPIFKLIVNVGILYIKARNEQFV